ncbi:hypothetical protein [Arthrobacter rhizosphaerae]|uniref:hypothetical protein n=1 Tax=Arthrobacter rhizosphaerae TaxID=2855490 RepID=UPI001FF14A50|nr:hypothetical protein [Arthrobacter rhizosphaerae]
METLTIKSPADLLSFIGHTLGFWPQGSTERTSSRSTSRPDAHDKEGPSDEAGPHVRTLLGCSHVARPMRRQ